MPTHQLSITEAEGSVMGCDIAGPGSDLAPLFEIWKGRAKLVWWVVHQDLMETVGKIVRSINDRGGRVRFLAIDDTGIGNGVSSRLLELQRWAEQEGRVNDPLVKCTIIRVTFGQSPQEHVQDKFVRIKDQLWWQMREDLQKRILGLPTDTELASITPKLPKGVSLVSQLVTPIYELDSRGRVQVYDKRIGDKEKTKALPARSPDLAHALILANHARRFLSPELNLEAPPKTLLEKEAREFRDEIRAIHKARHPQGPEDILSQGPEVYRYLDPFGEYEMD